jgi:hypothetical protein
MTDDRSVAVAARLMELGVSRTGIVDLIAFHPIDTIERQLEWLPLRKCRRPEAFIIEAIRNDYSKPNLYRNATNTAHHARKRGSVDEGSEPAD